MKNKILEDKPEEPKPRPKPDPNPNPAPSYKIYSTGLHYKHYQPIT
jgi:hypothetical protein